MIYMPICRHWNVRWLDSHTCRCHECGRTGRWYEDGFVLWSKRKIGPVNRSENNRLSETAST